MSIDEIRKRLEDAMPLGVLTISNTDDVCANDVFYVEDDHGVLHMRINGKFEVAELFAHAPTDIAELLVQIKRRDDAIDWGAKTIGERNAELAEAREALRMAKKCMPTHHYECEDSFYSCPSAIGYCGQDDKSKCDCRYSNVQEWLTNPAVKAAEESEGKVGE